MQTSNILEITNINGTTPRYKLNAAPYVNVFDGPEMSEYISPL
jgi:hypothetical protein